MTHKARSCSTTQAYRLVGLSRLTVVSVFVCIEVLPWSMLQDLQATYVHLSKHQCCTLGVVTVAPCRERGVCVRPHTGTSAQALKGGPKPSSLPFFREGFQIQFSPFGKFRTGRAFFSRPTPKFFANRFTEVGCGDEVVRAAAFEEDDCQERCRAAETTRTPRASTYFVSTTL